MTEIRLASSLSLEGISASGHVLARLRSEEGDRRAHTQTTKGDRTLTVQTTKGEHVLKAGVLRTGTVVEAPAETIAERINPLLEVAAFVMTALPDTSSRKVRAAAAMWHAAMDFFGFTRQNVNVTLPMALLICRSCPPVNYPLPPFFKRIVLPTTAASDVDAMRRAASLQVEGMHGFHDVLCDYRVLALQKAIGGRTRRLSTDKRPLLLSKVRDFWMNIETNHAASCAHVRDGFAVVLGLYLGTRVSELIAFNGEDIQIAGAASEKREYLLVTFKTVKNRQTLLGSHQPFRIGVKGRLLMRAFDVFNRVVGFSDGVPVFHRVTGYTPDRLSRSWYDGVIKRIDPMCSPHSVRVGMATELWAAGVKLPAIMAMGRWTSSAAILYILGSLDVTLNASQRLGDANLGWSSQALLASTGLSGEFRSRNILLEGGVTQAQWGEHCRLDGAE